MLLTKLFLKGKEPDEEINFDELFANVFAKLSPLYQIKRVYGTPQLHEKNVTLKKGHFKPVDFRLESRSGNKKVTCIYHLEQFDLDPNILQTRIKKKLGCSVTLSDVKPNLATEYVVCIQGNQIFLVSELLKRKF